MGFSPKPRYPGCEIDQAAEVDQEPHQSVIERCVIHQSLCQKVGGTSVPPGEVFIYRFKFEKVFFGGGERLINGMHGLKDALLGGVPIR
ncbi:hypothetical protein DMENIID0001_167170 [Sergentomyia squamirostris]